MHETIDEQGAWLRRVVMGFNAYHAVPTNAETLSDFRHNVADLWRRTLRRRGQKGAVTWDRMTVLTNRWLPRPRITTLGPTNVSPSNTQGGSPVREYRPPGSVRGASGNVCPYRDSARKTHQPKFSAAPTRIRDNRKTVLARRDYRNLALSGMRRCFAGLPVVIPQATVSSDVPSRARKGNRLPSHRNIQCRSRTPASGGAH
jgi:hypothetical protein